VIFASLATQQPLFNGLFELIVQLGGRLFKTLSHRVPTHANMRRQTSTFDSSLQAKHAAQRQCGQSSSKSILHQEKSGKTKTPAKCLMQAGATIHYFLQ